MSFEAMLNHKCDVYHIRKADMSPGYNLPGSPQFSYPDMPDIEGLQCHFNIRTGSQTRVVIQNAPEADYQAKIKLVVPLSADIRLNDKIVDIDTGYEYTAEIPIRVRDHHKFVMVHRTAAQEPL